MNRNILVVDDNAQLRLALRHILAREGYDVDEACDGQEALESIEVASRSKGYDLILMDIIMPRKEGLETILELRKQNPQMKIIAMSGGGRLNNFDPLKLARDCGANFVINKPFEPDKLRSLVRMCWP